MAGLKMGYVGAGFMAQRVHLPNFLALEDCELLALAELRPRLAARSGNVCAYRVSTQATWNWRRTRTSGRWASRRTIAARARLLLTC
jgi:hypothetical protein